MQFKKAAMPHDSYSCAVAMHVARFLRYRHNVSKLAGLVIGLRLGLRLSSLAGIREQCRLFDYFSSSNDS